MVFYLVELLLIRLDAPYFVVLLTSLVPNIPYGHLLWILSTGELRGLGWSE